MNPRVTITRLVPYVIIVNPWYVQPEPSTGGGWLFNDADNSAHLMLTWD